MIDEDTRRRFWEIACALQRPLLFGVAVLSAMLVLALFSLLFVQPGSMAYYVLQFDFLMLLPALGALVYILYRCLHRR